MSKGRKRKPLRKQCPERTYNWREAMNSYFRVKYPKLFNRP